MTLILVLLPGLDGTGVLFEPLIKALPDSFTTRVVAFPTDRHLSYSELLPIVLENCPNAGPFLLLGESFSGPLALMASAQKPPGLLAVILCASFIKNPVRFVPPWARVFVRPFLFRLFPLFAQAKALLGGYSTPSLRALMAKAHCQVSASVLADRVQSVLSVDVTAELQASTVPILYLAGKSDHVVSRRSLQAIQRIQADVQSVTIPAPHLVLQTKPEEAARAITDFVSSLGGY